MHTWNPSLYAVLNNNHVTALEDLGQTFPNPQSFRPANYYLYNQTMRMLADWCDFKTLAQVDKFLNYIYWNLQRKNPRRKLNWSSLRFLIPDPVPRSHIMRGHASLKTRFRESEYTPDRPLEMTIPDGSFIARVDHI